MKMEKMYQCSWCDAVFEEDEIKVVKTTYEMYYGISLEQYQSPTRLEISTCPFCDSEDIDECAATE